MGHLSIIVCTKDRPEDLTKLLNSIKTQTRLPDHLIIVDGSDNPIKHVVDNFPELNMDYVTVRPPSLPKQRNVGIGRLPDYTDWIGFLDDDLVLETDSFEQIIKSTKDLKTSRPLGGISMMITNVPEAPYRFWRGIFMLDHPKDGHFTSSGCPGMLRKIDHTKEVQWLSGGVTFWSKDVLDKFSFDEWFDGTGYMEDVDFSYSVNQEYALAYCGEAKCQHYHHPIPKSKMYALGVWQITAWWYFIKKNQSFNALATIWSMLGLSLNNFLMGIIRPEGFRFNKFLGNLKGLYLVFTSKAVLKRTWQK